MEPVSRLYLDTNIFIAMVEWQGRISDLLIELVLNGRYLGTPLAVTSELSLSELAVKPYRDKDEALLQRYERMIMSSEWLEVGPAERSSLYYAAVLRGDYRHLKLPDAIHLSTAIGIGCSHFLTADTGIRDRYELFHARHGLTKGPASISVIRPDSSTLETLLAGCQS